jgi:hypothetical protein
MQDAFERAIYKRPSRFVILRCAQDDTPEAASFDAHIVFFEMDCPLRVPGAIKNPAEANSSVAPAAGMPLGADWVDWVAAAGTCNRRSE